MGARPADVVSFFFDSAKALNEFCLPFGGAVLAFFEQMLHRLNGQHLAFVQARGSVYSLRLELFSCQAVCLPMSRSVVLLILMFLVALALPAAQYGIDSASAHAPASLTLAASSACTNGNALSATPIVQNSYSAAQACAGCKTCHVCPLAVLASGVACVTSVEPLFYTRPRHAAANWLSAEHAPDFKPPIL